MKVKNAIAYLKKQKPDDEIVFITMTRDEFIEEYVQWADNGYTHTNEKEVSDYLTKAVWEGIAEGIYQDDRVQEAFMDSARFDFKKIQDELQLTEETLEEESLWKE